MWQCSYCGENIDGGMFCTKCGRKKEEQKESVSDVTEDERIYPAKLLLDYSKSGGFRSDGCLKSYKVMCGCINEHETMSSMLQYLNTVASNSNQYATQETNANLLKVVMNERVPGLIERNETPLFYKDSAVMFYGKNGFLITNKALYRIKKKGVKKIFISDIRSLHLVDVLGGTKSFAWHINNDFDFKLDEIGTNPETAGLIMALICILYKDINPNNKIQFYNYLKRCGKCYEYVNEGMFCPKCGHSIEEDIDKNNKITYQNSTNNTENEEKTDILDGILEFLDLFS